MSPASTAAGNMGLKGLWAQVANSTAIVAFIVAFFLMMADVKALVREQQQSHQQAWERMRTDHRDDFARLTAAIDKQTISFQAVLKELKCRCALATERP